MRAWKDRTPLLRGRLHGRLLAVLGAVAVVAAAIAVWQFSTVLGGDGDETAAEVSFSADLDPGGASVVPLEEDTTPEDPASEATSPTTEAASETPEEPPSESDPEESSGEPDTGPTGPACTAALRLADDWSGSISVEVTIANTGDEAIDGWEIVLDIDGVEVTSAWGMSRVDRDRYGNNLFNGALDPGEDVAPSFRARATGDEGDLPGTVPCAATAAGG